jgi:ABC-2 type transport system ATP-binding protein
LRGGELRRRGEELLKRFGVFDRSNDRADKLSGGLKRRVELAKCLLHRPDVLILDEPGAGLDPGARIGLHRHLAELRDRDGVTSLLSTHLMDEADACDRIAILDRGRLVAADTPTALKGSFPGDVVTLTSRSVESLSPRLAEKLDIRGTTSGYTLRFVRERGDEIAQALLANYRSEIDSITVAKPSLDDVFLRLTGHSLEDESASVDAGLPTRSRQGG